ncbi:MAG: amidohydrolase family protein [Vicinamibacterales bacterium]
MDRFRADWVLPVAGRPIHKGWVGVDGGRIVDVGVGPADAVDLGSVALLPGLVNTHTHLELSHLRGQIAKAGAFTDWVQALLRLRRRPEGFRSEDVERGVTTALAEARRSGTVLFGDVANSLATVAAFEAAGASARVFLELIGFNATDPAGRVSDARASLSSARSSERVRLSLSAHAPYSVSPELFKAIRADLDSSADHVSAVHLAESPEEVELLARGTGPCRALLHDLGAWNPDWTMPAASPVEYLDELGFLDTRVIAVHGVQCTGEDLRRLSALGVTIASCPRSNEYVGVGAPPLEAFYAMDVEVAFGTDSLASVETLSLFDELKEARRLAPRVAAATLLRSATLVGARALGFGDDYGTLEPGRRAEIIAVRVPSGVSDVEEYLVGGIQPADVSWLQ